MIDNKTGVVILIKTNRGGYPQRYFNSFGKKNRLCTAWSLAGASVFLSSKSEDYQTVIKKLKAKKIEYNTVLISTANEPLKIEYKNRCFASIMEHFYLFAWGSFDFDIRNLREDLGQPRSSEIDKLNLSFEVRFYMVVSEVITLTKDKDLEKILTEHLGASLDVLEPVEFNDNLPF